MWIRWRDEGWNSGKWNWSPVCIVEKKGIGKKDAAIYLLMEYWKFDHPDGGNFNRLSEIGFLSADEINAIEREIWGVQSTRGDRTKHRRLPGAARFKKNYRAAASISVKCSPRASELI
jgi:hypothetical protein